MLERIKNIDTTTTCSEETLLYQLVSGLHTSINMHVSKNFFDQLTNSQGPNYQMFLKTIGKFPDRMKNLFFLYAVVLRAVNRAESILNAYDYRTEIDPK